MARIEMIERGEETRRRLMRLNEEDAREFIANMTPEDALSLDVAFEIWAHQGQWPPSGEGWRTWLMMAGRGYGKTRAGAEWVNAMASRGKFRFALVSASIDEARSVMVEGVSGLIAVNAVRGGRVKWEPSLKRLTWPSGSVAELFSGESPEGLRGPEHHFAWCDELAKWRHPEECWDNLQLGMRAGPRPRVLVTTTPRSIALIERLRKEPWTVETGGRTSDNMSLSKQFVDAMHATYAGTRIGRQEIDGEYLGEVEGSLFPRTLIERCRNTDVPQWFDRIVVGVDPPAGASERSDACGIVVVGRANGNFYVLADASVQGESPERWARAVAGVAAAWGTRQVIAEANQGGAMVESVLRAADAGMAVKLVHARMGKSARAEPIATLFEAGRAWMAGVFPPLEAELAGLEIGGRYSGPGRSPDRADAMVWAMTALSDGVMRVPRVVAL